MSAAVAESDKAEAILAAALELFVERGFHGTSVPSVADKAGVAAGTIYHYFASKEALVNAVYQRWKQELVAEMMAALPAFAPPREQFRAVWAKMAEFAVKHPKELAFLELHHHASYLDAESLAIEDRVFKLGETIVAQGQTGQVLKEGPPMLLIEFVDGAFLGVFRACLERRVPFTKETFMIAEKWAWEAVRI